MKVYEVSVCIFGKEVASWLFSTREKADDYTAKFKREMDTIGYDINIYEREVKWGSPIKGSSFCFVSELREEMFEELT